MDSVLPNPQPHSTIPSFTLRKPSSSGKSSQISASSKSAKFPWPRGDMN